MAINEEELSEEEAKKYWETKIKKTFKGFDELLKLEKGEWTSDGRKKITFLLSKVELCQSSYYRDSGGRKLASEILYKLCSDKKEYHEINFHRNNEFTGYKINDRDVGIGYCEIYEEEGMFIEIVLTEPAFNDFTKTISELLFKGKIKLDVVIKKVPNSEKELEDDLYVMRYVIYNSLKINN